MEGSRAANCPGGATATIAGCSSEAATAGAATRRAATRAPGGERGAAFAAVEPGGPATAARSDASDANDDSHAHQFGRVDCEVVG
jgi:hypothetical protein